MYKTLLRTMTALIVAIGLGAGAVASAGAQDGGGLPVPGLDGLLALLLGLIGSLLGGIPLPL